MLFGFRRLGRWRELDGAESQEHRDFFSCLVFGRRAGALLAGFVAGPFFYRVDEQAGIAKGFDVGFERLVKGPGVLPGGGAGMGGDGGFSGQQVSVYPAVLNPVLGIPAPAGFFWPAKARVHHYHHESAGRAKRAGDAGEDGGDRVDVLNRENARGRVEMVRGEVVECAGVADLVIDTRWAVLAGGADELTGGVDAGDSAGIADGGVEESAEHALAAGDVEEGFAGLGGEQSHSAGEDDMAVIFTAGFADELVIPLGDIAPIGRSAGRIFARRHG